MVIAPQPPHEHAISVHQARSRESLDRLMAASERLLRNRGAQEFTMGAVAAEAGVSVGGIYRRFENKRALLRALHEWMISGIERDVAAALHGPLPDLASVVDSYASVLVRVFSTDEQIFQHLFASVGPDPAQMERAQRGLQHSFAVFHTACLRHRDEIAHDDPEQAIAVAFHMIFSMSFARIARQTRPPFDRLPWTIMRAEISRAALGYLTRPAG